MLLFHFVRDESALGGTYLPRVQWPMPVRLGRDSHCLLLSFHEYNVVAIGAIRDL